LALSDARQGLSFQETPEALLKHLINRILGLFLSPRQFPAVAGVAATVETPDDTIELYPGSSTLVLVNELGEVSVRVVYANEQQLLVSLLLAGIGTQIINGSDADLGVGA
jgi:hypothetical protein